MKILLGLRKQRKVFLAFSASDLTIPQAAFFGWFATKSDCLFPIHSYRAVERTKEDMAYGLSRQQDVLYNIYRAGYLTKAEYEEYKAYDD